MSDGNTATQVSPIEDSEMSHVRSVFDRAANAIVQASELAKEVAAMREQMEALRKDMEYVRQRNQELDNLLNDVRQARDHAQGEVSRLTQVNNELTSENALLTRTNNDYKDRVARLEETISSLRKERDDAEMDNLHLHDELDKVKAKLDDVVSFAKGFVASVSPEPVKVAEPLLEPTPYVEPTPAQPYQEPQPTPAVWPNTTF